MKKQLMWRLLLVLVAAAALLLAAMPNSVTVVLENETVYGSFFAALPDGSYPVGLAVAGILCGACFGLAVIYAVMKKPFWLKSVQVTALAGACFSALPLVLGSQPPVLPNVAVTILLSAETLLALWVKKTPQEKKLANDRLKKH